MKPELGLITHDMLVQRAVKWLEGKKCGVVLSEYHCFTEEIPDVIGFYNRYSIVIECKVSRQDFKSDKHKPHRNGSNSMGNYRYYLTLPHIACKEDLPTSGWGLLYATDKKIIEIVKPQRYSNDVVRCAEWPILYSVVRRLKLRGHLSDIQKPL